MGAREELEKIVRGPYGTPEDAERAARAAEALAAYLRAEENAKSLLEDAALDRGTKVDLGSFSLHDAAERILEEAGVPLHVKELGKRIKAQGWRHRRQVSRPDQINYQLAARLPRHPDVFVRVAPNTFGLVRWGAARSAKGRAGPRLGLFRGSGKVVAASLGDSDDEAARSPWR